MEAAKITLIEQIGPLKIETHEELSVAQLKALLAKKTIATLVALPGAGHPYWDEHKDWWQTEDPDSGKQNFNGCTLTSQSFSLYQCSSDESLFILNTIGPAENYSAMEAKGITCSVISDPAGLLAAHFNLKMIGAADCTNFYDPGHYTQAKFADGVRASVCWSRHWSSNES